MAPNRWQSTVEFGIMSTARWRFQQQMMHSLEVSVVVSMFTHKGVFPHAAETGKKQELMSPTQTGASFFWVFSGLVWRHEILFKSGFGRIEENALMCED